MTAEQLHPAESRPSVAPGPALVPWARTAPPDTSAKLKASALLAERLREQILSGELRQGAALPVERALAADTGMSRTAVREALRMLEAEGLTETRPGRGGGSFVRRPSLDTMDRSLTAFIDARQVSFESLADVREALEPAVAELAARRRTNEDLAQIALHLHHQEQAGEDMDVFLLHNVEFHMAIVRAGHNDLMLAIIRSLSAAIHRGTEANNVLDPETRHQTVRAHQRLLDAIRRQDAPAAREAMSKHLRAYRVMVVDPVDVTVQQ